MRFAGGASSTTGLTGSGFSIADAVIDANVEVSVATLVVGVVAADDWATVCAQPPAKGMALRAKARTQAKGNRVFILVL